MEENINKNGKSSDESDLSPSLAIVKEKPPEILPIIPFYDRPAFPKMMRPIVIDNQDLIRMIFENAERKLSQYLGIILAKSPDIENDSPSVHMNTGNLYTVGVAAKVLQISQPQDDMPIQVIIQLIERFELSQVVAEKPIIFGKVKYWNETVFDNNEELKAYSVAIVDSIKELVKLNPLFKEGLTLLLERININDPGALSDFAASMTTASAQELQKILEIRNVRARIEEVLILLKREVEISKLKIEISKRIEDRLSKQQREFFLKQQLKEIKKELGLSKDDAESEIEKFEKRMKKLTLSNEARDHINEEIEKLKLLEPVSPEFNVSRNYLDWLTILPWGVYTDDNYDIAHAAEVLDQDHYGLKDVKDRILEFISVGRLKGNLAGSIILLVGPPGVGKTSVGQSIARSLGREFYRFSLGGIRDEAEIKGHRRTYIGALPGKFLMAIKTCKTSNPVIMLDEIDKIGASFRGDPASALLEVLDPEQNKDFLDHYLDVRFDLSHVLFVCTANQLDTIPGPLLDRMEVIRLSGYVLEEKIEIARRFLIPKQMIAHGLEPKQVVISKDVLTEIIDGYSREAGVRGLENNIKKILRKSVKSIINKNVPGITIKKTELEDLLGRRYFTDDKIFKKPKIGVVMGLAYTALGGATLFVESSAVPSNGPGLKHTGQLGDVMIESAEIAYTYVRSMFRTDESVTKLFSNNLIHLHVPAGATPKDGPSAGITMASSIYSLVKNIPPVENLAMTGELTLTGRIIPIGGVKEKVIAANRAKVSQLIFPAENKEDFEKLDDYIKNDITPHYVTDFDEVLKICFPNKG